MFNLIENEYNEYFRRRIVSSKNLTIEPIIKIFIMTHKDFINKRYNHAYTIVADNFSNVKNEYDLNLIFAKKGKLYNMKRSYGEMSKLYFIYQLYKEGKISSKYIGLNHYSRYFEFTDKIPNLDKIFKNNDVILPKKYFLKTSVMKNYCIRHICQNFVDSLDIIKKIKPDYYDTALKFAKNKEIYYLNIFIMKKDDFFKYCEFIFDILFEFDKRYHFKTDEDVLKYTTKIFSDKKKVYRQSRLDGFLAERLSNIFYNKHFKKIKEYKIVK